MENDAFIYEASSPLSDLHPVTKVQVGSTRRSENGWEWITVNALWDTGATLCAISRNLCDRLGLKAEQYLPTRNFSNPEGIITPYDAVLLKIIQGPYAIFALANIFDNSPIDYDMLIGMNVISAGKFSLTVNKQNIDIRLEIARNFRNLKKLRNVPEFPEEDPDIPEL